MRVLGNGLRPLTVALCCSVCIAGGCFDESDWTGSFVRKDWPANKDTMHITPSAKGFDVTVDPKEESWTFMNATLPPTYGTPEWDGSVSIVIGEGKHAGTTMVGIVDNATECTKVFWDNDSVWCKNLTQFKIGDHTCGQAAEPPQADKVYVVFSNHLDVGYTDNNNGSCAGAVTNRYWKDHFPKAMATADAFRKAKGPAYRWMTQSWLVAMFRACNDSKVNIDGPGAESQLNCPDADALAAFDAGVRRGDITWHAFPFNPEPEMYDTALFNNALDLTFAEDEHFGHAPRMTYSQRDVPGLTRAAIPLFAARGVKAVSVGENGACAAVNVPPIFVWHDNATDTEVLALFHPRGYGSLPPARDDGSRRRTQAHAQLEAELQFDEWEGEPSVGQLGTGMSDCVIVHGARKALCYAWKSDNQGPHSYDEANGVFKDVARLFPGAEVVASDAFDDFVSDVWDHRGSLPVVTAEIGDTWIHGASSDPRRTAAYRAASRAARAAPEEASQKSAARTAFERLLMKVGEHTWGWNGGSIRKDSWLNQDLEKTIADSQSSHGNHDFYTAPLTWIEQRAFVDNAIDALTSVAGATDNDRALAAAIKKEVALATTVTPFDTTGYTPVDATGVFDCGALKVGFGATGGMTTLNDWADDDHPIAQPRYQAMSGDFFHTFTKQYNYHTAGNFDKTDLSVPSMDANVTLLTLLRRTADDDSATSFIYNASLPDAAHTSRGAPSTVAVRVDVPHAASEDGWSNITVTLQWYNKTRTHIPETFWLFNRPIVSNPKGWSLEKLGSWVNAADADLGDNCDPSQGPTTCGVHLHAVGDAMGGALYSGTEGRVAVTSLDSALLSVGEPIAVPTPLSVPNATGGVHYALVGNIWNTNYPFWYPFTDLVDDTSSQFRFTISLAAH